MKISEGIQPTLHKNSVTKNTFYNLIGYGVPVLFALFIIPHLISGLGTEKFGILSLAWIVIGYFSFFDFGIGKGLTRITAELVGLKKYDQISTVFWTSLFVMLIISLLLTISLSFFIPSLVNVFNISAKMQNEANNIFFVLVLSIPIVSTSAGLRGILEAYQEFGVVNVIRVILGILTFLGPLLVLAFTDNLFWIVFFLVIIRIIIWNIYLIQCFKINKTLLKNIKINFSSIKPVLRFSIWITLANIIGPAILFSDRFLVGSIVSAEALTYYSTPYEIVTKLLLIPTALSGVLFPMFSSTFFVDPIGAKKLLLRGVKFIFFIVFPLVFLIITFAYYGMNLWLGENFAIHSSVVLQFLSIGIFMNSLSMIPDSFFQGIGKPKIPTLIMLIELPFYLSIMWFMIKTQGIVGGAIVFMVAATINTTVMFFIAYKKFGIKFNSKSIIVSLVLVSFSLYPAFIVNHLIPKLILSLLFVLIFILVIWKLLLNFEEKGFLLGLLKMKNL